VISKARGAATAQRSRRCSLVQPRVVFASRTICWPLPVRPAFWNYAQSSAHMWPMHPKTFPSPTCRPPSPLGPARRRDVVAVPIPAFPAFLSDSPRHPLATGRQPLWHEPQHDGVHRFCQLDNAHPGQPQPAHLARLARSPASIPIAYHGGMGGYQKTRPRPLNGLDVH
jgi:hypothetical protein